MSAIAIKDLKVCLRPEISTSAKIVMCYIAAHLTAISAVGLLYLVGIFDVGFLASESFAVKLLKYVSTIVA